MKYPAHLTIALVIFVSGVFGQNYNTHKGTSSYKSVINFSEIAAWDKEHPLNEIKMKVPNKEMFVYPEFSIDGTRKCFIKMKEKSTP